MDGSSLQLSLVYPQQGRLTPGMLAPTRKVIPGLFGAGRWSMPGATLIQYPAFPRLPGEFPFFSYSPFAQCVLYLLD